MPNYPLPKRIVPASAMIHRTLCKVVLAASPQAAVRQLTAAGHKIVGIAETTPGVWRIRFTL